MNKQDDNRSNDESKVDLVKDATKQPTPHKSRIPVAQSGTIITSTPAFPTKRSFYESGYFSGSNSGKLFHSPGNSISRIPRPYSVFSNTSRIFMESVHSSSDFSSPFYTQSGSFNSSVETTSLYAFGSGDHSNITKQNVDLQSQTFSKERDLPVFTKLPKTEKQRSRSCQTRIAQPIIGTTKLEAEFVDFISELDNGFAEINSLIFSYLYPKDLCVINLVSVKWRQTCLNDAKANSRRVKFLNEIRTIKSIVGEVRVTINIKMLIFLYKFTLICLGKLAGRKETARKRDVSKYFRRC